MSTARTQPPSPGDTLALKIDHLILPAHLALPPGGLSGLEAAIAQALQHALQGGAPTSGTDGRAGRPRPAADLVATQIAQALLPQIQPQWVAARTPAAPEVSP